MSDRGVYERVECSVCSGSGTVITENSRRTCGGCAGSGYGYRPIAVNDLPEVVALKALLFEVRSTMRDYQPDLYARIDAAF